MKNLLNVIILFIFISVAIPAQTNTLIDSSRKFDIAYLADGEYACNKLWLEKIRDDWQATGVNLRIFRSGVEKFSGGFNWNNYPYEVDSALLSIANAGLNIYLRINLALLDMQDVKKKYTDDDFQIRSNGKRFLNQYDGLKRPLLNLTSLKARGDMLNFISVLVNHLKNQPANVRNRIKLIVPTLTQDDETELPFSTYDENTKSVAINILSGFSSPEINAFLEYLKKKYVFIDSLNRNWGEGADFANFDSSQIQIRNYNWDGIKTDSGSPDYYIYENGRKDFLDFRRQEFKRFIDDCSKIIRNAGFNFGVQFGSVYDGLIEFRGFYDPTPLIENVDQVITDDIPEYYPNFAFAADYLRSLCKFWMWKNNTGKQIAFGTEINWPGYGNHSSMDLIKYWAMQLRTFYEKGSSVLFVAQWGTLGSPNNTTEKVISGSLMKDYNKWQDSLKQFRRTNIVKISNDYAFNLSCELVLQSNKNKPGKKNIGITITADKTTFEHNNGILVGKLDTNGIYEFPLVWFSKHQEQNENQITYNDNGDFVTNYMLLVAPDYAKKNYNHFYLTGSSVFIPKTIKIQNPK